MPKEPGEPREEESQAENEAEKENWTKIFEGCDLEVLQHIHDDFNRLLGEFHRGPVNMDGDTAKFIENQLKVAREELEKRWKEKQGEK